MEKVSKEVNYKVKNKLLKENQKIIVWNAKRGEGKTDFIIKRSMFTKDTRFLVIVQNMLIRNAFDANLRYVISAIEDNNINVKYHNYVNTYTFSYDRVSKSIDVVSYMDIFNGLFDVKNYDCVFIDEIGFIDIEKLCLNKLKSISNQLYILGTMHNVKFIDTYNTDDTVDVENFYDNQIRELKEEFSKIEKTSKTVMIRKDILNQIDMLLSMKKIEGIK